MLSKLQFLKNHPKIDKGIMAGFEDHPNHQIAKSQMNDFGGMISFVPKGSSTIHSFNDGEVKIFTIAESLDGVESLSGHPASMTHASIQKLERKKWSY